MVSLKVPLRANKKWSAEQVAFYCYFSAVEIANFSFIAHRFHSGLLLFLPTQKLVEFVGYWRKGYGDRSNIVFDS